MLLERVTKAMPIIDNDHKYIHEGRFFSTFQTVTLSGSATYSFGFYNNSDSTYIHYRMAKIATNQPLITVDLLDNAVFVGGTAMATYNHNRPHGRAGSLVVTTGVTLSAATTINSDIIFGAAGQGNTRVGGESSGSAEEWVFGPKASFAGTLTNGTTATATIQVSMKWYEEDDG
jgi:hypothetical protein